METKTRKRFDPERPDPNAEDLGYSFMPRQAFKRLNSRTGNGFIDEHRRVEYLESLYVQCTDGVIGILDGSINKSDENNKDNARLAYSEYDGEPSDCVVFLDKSARPISYLVSEFWDLLAKPDVGKPEFSHVNIDKEIWLQMMHVPMNRIQKPKPEDFDFSKIDSDLLEDRVRQLRAVYVTPQCIDQVNEDDLSNIWDLKTTLDGRNVAILDEVESSGYTLKTALELYKRSFPNTKFSTLYWTSPRKIQWFVEESDGNVSKEFAASWVPFWYDSETSSGRGIGEIDPVFSEQSSDIRQRLGKFILSTPYHRVIEERFELITDKMSEETYSDLDLLVHRFKSGNILYRPHPERPDFEERALTSNGFSTIQDFAKAVHGLK